MTELTTITPIDPAAIPPAGSTNLDALPAVTHTPVTMDEHINEETLNRGAVTVSASTTDRLSTLVSRINGTLETLSTSVNAQTGEVVSHINLIVNQVTENLALLSSGIEHALGRIDEIEQNDLSGLDNRVADLEQKADNLITVTEKLAAELALTANTVTKTVIISAAIGEQAFSLAELGAGTFESADDYQVIVQVVGTSSVKASIPDKTVTGFTVALLSDGVHYTPQPHNAALEPVVINLVITSRKGEL